MKRLTVVPILLGGCGPTGPDADLAPEPRDEAEIAGAGCLVITSDGSSSEAYDYDQLGRLVRYDDGERVVELAWSGDGLEVSYPLGSYAAWRGYDPELGYPFAILEVKESQIPGFSHQLETTFTYRDGLLVEQREDEVWPGDRALAWVGFDYGPGARLEARRRRANGATESTHYAYDPSGRLESADVYRDGEPIDTWTFHYDRDGKPTRIESAVGAPATTIDYDGDHCRRAAAAWPAGQPEAHPASHPRPVVQ